LTRTSGQVLVKFWSTSGLMCENGAANFVSASQSGNRQAHEYFKLFSSHFGYIRVISAKYKG